MHGICWEERANNGLQSRWLTAAWPNKCTDITIHSPVAIVNAAHAFVSHKSLKTNVENECNVYDTNWYARIIDLFTIVLHVDITISSLNALILAVAAAARNGFHFSAYLPKCFMVSVDMLNSREWTTGAR